MSWQLRNSLKLNEIQFSFFVAIPARMGFAFERHQENKS